MGQTLIFTVEGMKCGGCRKKIEEAISLINPETQISIDLEKKLVTVQGENLNPLEIKNEINNTGFQVSQMAFDS